MRRQQEEFTGPVPAVLDIAGRDVLIRPYGVDDIVAGIKRLLEVSSTDDRVMSLGRQLATAEAIHEWVRDNVLYVHDPTRVEGGTSIHTELIKSASRMLDDYYSGLGMRGDCDDHAVLTVSLLQAAGIMSHVVLLDQHGGGYDHALAEVMTPSGWVMSDPSEKAIPFGYFERHYQKLVI